MNKCIVDGKVAVLYSPGHGAGWSTWHRFSLLDSRSNEVMFDPVIVDLLENGGSDYKEKIINYVVLKYGTDFYTGGIDQLKIAWLPVGTKFRITEYDGYEDIEVADDIQWIVA